MKIHKLVSSSIPDDDSDGDAHET